ncbi:hypothetical protein RRF57_012267 [Xylaria bambusicola]|uniref:Uncharacterized protein n=1 Tax=Xylaria bambusicola TaxID=326684 RepID=A0AAN7UPA1_9PEZI
MPPITGAAIQALDEALGLGPPNFGRSLLFMLMLLRLSSAPAEAALVGTSDVGIPRATGLEVGNTVTGMDTVPGSGTTVT